MEPAIETAKSKVEILLNKLPDDSTLEDIQYHLYVLEKIEQYVDGLKLKQFLDSPLIQDAVLRNLAGAVRINPTSI